MNDKNDLHNKNCIPCKGGIPSFAISEIHKYLKKIDGWDVKKKEKETYFLEKNFTFANFIESQKFVNQVGNSICRHSLSHIAEVAIALAPGQNWRCFVHVFGPFCPSKGSL